MSTALKATVTTDGSCHPNDGTGCGGWAAVIRVEGRAAREVSGGLPRGSTNNVAELTAILEGLRALEPDVKEVSIRTDSQYAMNSLTIWQEGWARRGWITSTGTPVRNRELIETTVAEMSRRVVTISWTRGHIGDPDNERCDELALIARQVEAGSRP
jgi:ribonuclease HI